MEDLSDVVDVDLVSGPDLPDQPIVLSAKSKVFLDEALVLLRRKGKSAGDVLESRITLMLSNAREPVSRS